MKHGRGEQHAVPKEGARLTELPAFSAHHLLEGQATNTFGIANEGDFGVLPRAWMLVGNH